MSDQGPNHELFVKVLAQIERAPETWNQGTFAGSCGTAYCFAGHALVLSGFEPWQDYMGHRAAGLLGIEWRGNDTTLGWGNGCPLFSAANSLDGLYRISADLLGIDETVLRDKVRAEVTA